MHRTVPIEAYERGELVGEGMRRCKVGFGRAVGGDGGLESGIICCWVWMCVVSG